MRRLLPLLLLGCVLAPLPVSAAGGWTLFSSRAFSFSVRHPSNWKVSVVNGYGGKQVTMIFAGKVNYSINVSLLPLRPAGSTTTLRNNFVTYERQQMHDPSFARVHWVAARLGGQPAMAGVVTPATEGGVKLSTAVYIAGWRRYTYLVQMVAYQRLQHLSQFPAVYGQILGTWHFL